MGGIILLIFGVFLLVCSVWYSIRNERVFTFRTKVLTSVFKMTTESINNGDYTDYNNIYHNMGSYDKMMFSFKPLKPKYWMNEEDYLKIIKYW